MSKEHFDLIRDALFYFRHVGADARALRTYVGIRETEKRDAWQDAAVLQELETDGTVFHIGTRWFLTPEGSRLARIPALAPEWQSEDAWLLLSLLYCDAAQSATLPQ